MSLTQKISDLRTQIKTLESQSEQVQETMNSAIRTKEWHFVKTASDNLIYIEDKIEDLRRDVGILQSDLDREALEVVT